MPQDLLHAPHGPQPVTWQFRGSGNTKIRDKFVSENIFSLSYSFSSFSSWSAAASSCVSRPSCSTSSVSRRRPRSGCTELTCFLPATRRDCCRLYKLHVFFHFQLGLKFQALKVTSIGNIRLWASFRKALE